TEASYRFERAVDPALPVRAADRACSLIKELGIGEPIAGVIDEYPEPIVPRRLTIRPTRTSALLGYEVSGTETDETLRRLGFGVEAGETAISVTVPTSRPDIVREEDLVEE